MDAFYAWRRRVLDNPALRGLPVNRRRATLSGVAPSSLLGVVRGAQIRRALRNADRASAQTLSAGDLRAGQNGSLRGNLSES